jgi:hypothetical protein
MHVCIRLWRFFFLVHVVLITCNICIVFMSPHVQQFSHHEHPGAYTYMHTYIHTHIYIYIHIHTIWIPCLQICFSCMQACAYELMVNIMRRCAFLCMCICMYACAHTYLLQVRIGLFHSFFELNTLPATHICIYTYV